MNQHFEQLFNLYLEGWREKKYINVECFLNSNQSDPLTIKDKSEFDTRLYGKMLRRFKQSKETGMYNSVTKFLNSTDSDPLTDKTRSKFEKLNAKWLKGMSIGKQLHKIKRSANLEKARVNVSSR